MLSDTHCHLDFPEFDSDREEVIARARDAGLGLIVNIGSSLDSSRASVSLAACHDIIWAAVGIHPHDADTFDKDTQLAIEELIRKDKVIAVGEIGLDYYRNISEKNNQKDMFATLLSLAENSRLPVIIHNRQASEDTFDIINTTLKKPVRGVIHCFSAEQEFLEKFLDLGLYISFTCNITYKKAENLRNLAQFVPIERLLLETDAPFLPPQDYRGKRNEPAYVKYLVEELSRIKDISSEVLISKTFENGKRLFNVIDKQVS